MDRERRVKLSTVRRGLTEGTVAWVPSTGAAASKLRLVTSNSEVALFL